MKLTNDSPAVISKWRILTKSSLYLNFFTKLISYTDNCSSTYNNISIIFVLYHIWTFLNQEKFVSPIYLFIIKGRLQRKGEMENKSLQPLVDSPNGHKDQRKELPLVFWYGFRGSRIWAILLCFLRSQPGIWIGSRAAWTGSGTKWDAGVWRWRWRIRLLSLSTHL